MDQVVQIIGALLVLAGFVLAQVRVLDQRSATYLLLNLVGSALLTALAWEERQWGSSYWKRFGRSFPCLVSSPASGANNRPLPTKCRPPSPLRRQSRRYAMARIRLWRRRRSDRSNRPPPR